jgi:hypothetical protein
MHLLLMAFIPFPRAYLSTSCWYLLAGTLSAAPLFVAAYLNAIVFLVFLA